MDGLDDIAIYSGYKVTEENDSTELSQSLIDERIPLNDDDILSHAEQKAAAIIQAARDEADQIREEIRIETLEVEKERAAIEITERVNEFTKDIWNSNKAMSEILGVALSQILGSQAMPDAQLRAIEHAVSQYYEGRILTIRLNAKEAARLKVVMLGYKNGSLQELIELKDDISIAPGRCILEVNGRSIEVGIDQQIDAFKTLADKYFHQNGAAPATSKQ